MNAETHLENSFEKIKKFLSEDDRAVLQTYINTTEHKAYHRGKNQAELATQIIIGTIAFVFIMAMIIGGMKCNYEATHFPPTECPDPQLSLSDLYWKSADSNTRSPYLESHLKDGTRCWKKEGSGSMVCLLP